MRKFLLIGFLSVIAITHYAVAQDRNISGKVTSEDKSSIEKNTKQVKLTEEQAKKIALAEVNGEIEDIDLEEEDDSVFYEVEIDSGQQEAAIQIDAFTGKILSVAIVNEED